MERKSKSIKFILALLPVFLLTSCSEEKEVKDTDIRITFVQNANVFFYHESYVVKKGNNLTIPLDFVGDNTFLSCSYSSYSFADNFLTLYQVNYPERIIVETKINDGKITYDINGGEFINSEYSGNTYTLSYLKGKHLRINTSLGTDYIKRDGYLLKCWNTKADGTGDDISLGSRVTISDSDTTLFAKWIKTLPISDFEYTFENNNVKLTSYTGEQKVFDEFVLPSTIEGKEVTSIKEDFLSGVTGESLYLSDHIKTIENNAFKDINFKEIHFYDNLKDVSDLSFSNYCFDKYYINASILPDYAGVSTHSFFTESMDRLILNQDMKKIIFFAGCSMSYGLKSDLIQKEYPSYLIQDMGFIGASNAAFQFDIISKYLKEDDIFIHAPEITSSYQLMNDIDSEYRMFVMTQGNYDLLSLASLKNCKYMFDSYNTYTTLREIYDKHSYDTCLTDHNVYGDINTVRNTVNNSDDKKSTIDYSYDFSLLNDYSLTNLTEKYTNLINKGVKVLFSFSPVNRNGLREEQVSAQSWNSFESYYKEKLPLYGVSLISKATDYLYLGRYFYDEDYHLNDEGAALRSQNLLNDLKSYLAKGNNL